MNNLTGLNLSGLSNLTYLNCSGNNISGFNFTQCTGFTGFYANNNNLTGELDLTQFKNLTETNISDNELSGVKITGLNKLLIFKADNNYITGIDFSGTTNLKTISASGNSLTGFLSNFNVTGLTYINLLGNSIGNYGQLYFWLSGQYGNQPFLSGAFLL